MSRTTSLEPHTAPNRLAAAHFTRPTRPTRHGMTLVEVLAVVVILGLLAATLAIGFSGAFGKGKHELAKTGIGQIVGKIEVYRMDTSTWPDLETGLSVLANASPTSAYYLPADNLLDPWDRPYIYITPGPDGHPYEVVSYGADGQLGGEDEDADLSSVSLRGNKK